jgi:hypothetical protein
MPTPMRAATSCGNVRASPHNAVIPLHTNSANAMMSRRTPRSAQRRDRDAERRVENCERDAGQEAERGVRRRELALDRLEQDVQDAAIDEVDDVDDEQQAECVAAVALAHGELVAAHRPILRGEPRRGKAISAEVPKRSAVKKTAKPKSPTLVR